MGLIAGMRVWMLVGEEGWRLVEWVGGWLKGLDADGRGRGLVVGVGGWSDGLGAGGMGWVLMGWVGC